MAERKAMISIWLLYKSLGWIIVERPENVSVEEFYDVLTRLAEAVASPVEPLVVELQPGLTV